MINQVKKDTSIRMEKCIESFEKKINKIHTGRASPEILDDIRIEHHGNFVPLLQLSHIFVENARTLAITVFDQKLIPKVEKALLASDIDLTPISSSNIIRLSFPSLTEERRRSLVKIVKASAEYGRVSIRGIRRDINLKLKNMLKDKKINIDEDRIIKDEIQKLTDFWIKKIDNIFLKKETELMKF